jgi:hypothetical protein
MTEPEWLTCSAPWTMLLFVRNRLSDRKRRLFACACCRLIWEHLPGEHVRQAVELGERYADGLVIEQYMEAARRQFNRAVAHERGARARLAQAAGQVLRARFHPESVATLARTGRGAHRLYERQCDLLRDLFAPFRRQTLGEAWQASAAVIDLARGIDEARCWSDLPILADALEDVGCTDAGLLAHLRGPGGHTLGCWAVDAVLGRT